MSAAKPDNIKSLPFTRTKNNVKLLAAHLISSKFYISHNTMLPPPLETIEIFERLPHEETDETTSPLDCSSAANLQLQQDDRGHSPRWHLQPD